MTELRFQVRWAEAAVVDLEEIVSYVASNSPINAQRLLERLTLKAESLEVAPLRGRVVPELKHFGIHTWREVFSRPYRIIFRVDKKVVYVLAVLDGRRDLEDLLLERLVRSPES